MKHVLLAFALCVSFSGFAQILNVSSIDKVNLPGNDGTTVAAISPQGDYLLLTSAESTGLTKLNLANNETTVLTTAPGAGYNVKISQDGLNVVYRENSFSKDHLKYVSLKSINLATKASQELVSATRDLQGFEVETTGALAVNKGKLAAKSFGSVKTNNQVPVLSINNRQLMITVNGKTSVLSPNGKEYSYVWPSVSPDGTKILYYVCGIGAYVCDLKGGNVKSLGMMQAPQWYNNNVVIGMNESDNGEEYTASTIVATTLNGEHQVLTDNNVIAMYPHSTLAGDKIAFSTPAGEAYIINIK